ncbi:hypothetical protein DIPPA_53936 [Diplonema papillatum]|nr:hypothetical protein DIPPA_53936 [Diplonema papillatum]
MEEDLESILSAVFSTTTFDLQFSESPADPEASLKRRGSSTVSTPIDHPSSTPEASKEKGKEQLSPLEPSLSPWKQQAQSARHGPILNGEQVKLVLSLTPVPEKLRSTFEDVFGLADDEKILTCWNALTSSLYVTIGLFPPSHPAVQAATANDRADVIVCRGNFPDESAGQCDLELTGKAFKFESDLEVRENHFPNSHAADSRKEIRDPDYDAVAQGAVYPTKQYRPVRESTLATKRGKPVFKPSLYRLDFVAKHVTCRTEVKHFIHLRISLGQLAHLQSVVARVTGHLPVNPLERRVTRALPDAEALCVAAGDLCHWTESEDRAVLNNIMSFGGNSDPSWTNAPCLATMIRPALLIEPLKAEVNVAEPFPGLNCVQVTVSNPLTHDLHIQELCIHLPTTVPLEYHEQEQAKEATAPILPQTTTMCTLKSAPADFVTSVVAANGFETVYKLQCYMVAVDGETLPVCLRGGETYGFVFYIRPYDMNPQEATPPPVGKAPHVRGAGDRIDAPTDFMKRSTFRSQSEPCIPGNAPAPPRAETVKQCSKLTISFKVDGLTSFFDKEADVKWTLQLKAPHPTSDDSRLKAVLPYTPFRARRKETAKGIRSRSTSPQTTC